MLFVGDDWAEDHHDVELMDAAGRTLAKARLPEGVAGIARMHAMIGAQLGEDAEDTAGQVAIGIETDRGPWVQALIAAGYTVFAVNPLQAARYRDRLGVSGAKSAEQYREPVRGRFGDGSGADIAASTGAIVDDELLVKRFAKMLRERTGQQVGPSAGGKWQNYGDGP